MHPITTSYLKPYLGNIWSSVKILPEFAGSFPVGLKKKLPIKMISGTKRTADFFAREKNAVFIISSLFLDAAGRDMDRY